MTPQPTKLIRIPQALARTVALLLTLALLFAACGSDSDDTDATGADAATETPVTEDPTAAPEADPEPEPEADPEPEAEPEPTEEVVEPEPTEEVVDPAVVADGAIVELFMDGALASDIVTVDCTLSDGSESSCYQITVAGYPADGDVGPFCPTTTSDTADQVGIWFDGNELYDLDGQFILDLPEIYNDDNWLLHDEDGHVHVTDTEEAFDAAARPDVAEEYQNHCVEGQIAWLDGGVPVTSTIEVPVTPVASDSITQGNGNLGVTLNGVIIAAAAPVDAILGAYTIAAFDDCGGHINPVDGYHLHGATGCSEVGDAADGETPVFAIAMDGYPVHSPLDDADAANADLDECNGHTTDELGYHYHANSPEENAVLSCYTGLTAGTASGDGGGPPAGGRPDGPPPGDG